MVMKPEPWGEALDAVGAGGATLVVTDPGGRAVHAGARPRAGRAASTWSSPAGATRASTSGSSRTPPTAARGARDLARRLRPQRRRGRRAGDHRGGRPAAARASWATPSRWSRSRTRTACSSTPSTPSPPPGAAATSRRCCCRGDHGAIAAWRHEQAVRRTADAPPDLLPAVGAASSDVGADVRRAEPADAGELLTLQRACWLQEEQANPGVADPGAATSRSTTYARGSASGPCGRPRRAGRLVGAVRGRSLRDGEWHIGRLMVAPDLQGRGLGRGAPGGGRGGGAGRGDGVRAVHRRGQRATTCGCTRRPGYRLRRPEPQPGRRASMTKSARTPDFSADGDALADLLLGPSAEGSPGRTHPGDPPGTCHRGRDAAGHTLGLRPPTAHHIDPRLTCGTREERP